MPNLTFYFAFNKPMPTAIEAEFWCDVDGVKGPLPRARFPMTRNGESGLIAQVPISGAVRGVQYWLKWRRGASAATYRLVAVHDWPIKKVVAEDSNFVSGTTGWVAGVVK